MKRTTLFLGAGALFLAAACTEQTPTRQAERTPAPAKPALPARAADAGPVTDARPGRCASGHDGALRAVESQERGR